MKLSEPTAPSWIEKAATGSCWRVRNLGYWWSSVAWLLVASPKAAEAQLLRCSGVTKPVTLPVEAAPTACHEAATTLCPDSPTFLSDRACCRLSDEDSSEEQRDCSAFLKNEATASERETSLELCLTFLANHPACAHHVRQRVAARLACVSEELEGQQLVLRRQAECPSESVDFSKAATLLAPLQCVAPFDVQKDGPVREIPFQHRTTLAAARALAYHLGARVKVSLHIPRTKTTIQYRQASSISQTPQTLKYQRRSEQPEVAEAELPPGRYRVTVLAEGYSNRVFDLLVEPRFTGESCEVATGEGSARLQVRLGEPLGGQGELTVTSVDALATPVTEPITGGGLVKPLSLPATGTYRVRLVAESYLDEEGTLIEVSSGYQRELTLTPKRRPRGLAVLANVVVDDQFTTALALAGTAVFSVPFGRTWEVRPGLQFAERFIGLRPAVALWSAQEGMRFAGEAGATAFIGWKKVNYEREVLLGAHLGGWFQVPLSQQFNWMSGASIEFLLVAENYDALYGLLSTGVEWRF